MQVLDLKGQALKGKRVLIREDLNVPIKAGQVTSDARIRAAWPTIEYAINAGAKVMVMSHLGRPVEGKSILAQPEFSLVPVARCIEKLTGKRVQLVDDYLDGFEWQDADFVLFENVRINQGEAANDERLARKLAALCDLFVMDAFGTAHRAQASTEGVARYAPVACAGPLLLAELGALDKALSNPRHPVVAVVGGSKVSTKLEVLDALSGKVDTLIVGGGIANTFLAATGHPVGKSLCENDLIDSAKALLSKVDIPIPVDVVVGASPGDTSGVTRSVDDVGEADMILDIGPVTMARVCDLVKAAGTIIWNGPVGVFENDAFGEGTRALSEAIAESDAFSLAGGGDTLAAIDKYDVADRISYISTGGGAFLEFVEGKTLPAVAALESRYNG
ncbi:MAG: phosphoglycerate kinase [Pseudomonadales bacterium]